MQEVKTSLPARGAWVEIKQRHDVATRATGRSPHGERGLKFATLDEEGFTEEGRSPHGERGLKLGYI